MPAALIFATSCCSRLSGDFRLSIISFYRRDSFFESETLYQLFIGRDEMTEVRHLSAIGFARYTIGRAAASHSHFIRF